MNNSRRKVLEPSTSHYILIGKWKIIFCARQKLSTITLKLFRLKTAFMQVWLTFGSLISNIHWCHSFRLTAAARRVMFDYSTPSWLNVTVFSSLVSVMPQRRKLPPDSVSTSPSKLYYLLLAYALEVCVTQCKQHNNSSARLSKNRASQIHMFKQRHFTVTFGNT